MLKQPSENLMFWEDERLGGALQTTFAPPSSLPNLPMRFPESAAYENLPVPLFEWAAADETTDGAVRFRTTVDIDVATPDQVLLNAWHRMICFYVVGRLTGESLLDACQSLADIYAWQLDQTKPIAQNPEQKRHAVSQVRKVERVPFEIESG